MYIIGKGVIGEELVTSFKKKDIVFKDWETGVLWSLDDGGNVINSVWERTPISKEQKN